jgi:hypothetical protein
MSDRAAFRTGVVIPKSGIYRVIHGAHRLPHEVTLFADGVFPRCSKCEDEVVFELLHAVPALKSEGRRLFELPVIDEDEQAAIAL